MIIDIRGTNGAGKSTLVRELGLVGSLKHDGVWITDGQGFKFKVIGKYDTPCGGCDGVKTMDLVTREAYHYHSLGYPTIIEGAIIGTIFQRFDRLAERVDNEYVVIHLTTPVETCIQQVLSRRMMAGNDTPFDANKSLVPRFHAIQSAVAKFEAAGRHVVRANFDSAKATIERLIAHGLPAL